MKILEHDYKKLVGHRVRSLRHAAHLSQDELAERCGIYRTYLSRIEGGTANPTLLVLVALVTALNVSLLDLVQEVDAVPPKPLDQ